jgi:excisionase family DNA binding protein
MRDRVMTVREVAQYLNIHSMTLYKLVREGRIPAFKVGGQWRFRKKDLDSWVVSKTEKNRRG